MTSPSEIRLLAYLVAKPGREADLAAALTAIVPAVLAEPGCLAYAPHLSLEEPGTLVMYEGWASEAALEAHAAGAAFAGLAARFDELLDEPLRLERLRPIA